MKQSHRVRDRQRMLDQQIEITLTVELHMEVHECYGWPVNISAKSKLNDVLCWMCLFLFICPTDGLLFYTPLHELLKDQTSGLALSESERHVGDAT